MKLIAIAGAALLGATTALAANGRDWQSVGLGWHFDAKDVKVELKDDVVNTENTVVFQMVQDESGKRPGPTVEPTSQLYVMCETRQYRMWDLKALSQIGPISTQMFEPAQTLEQYCERIGKLPEERKRGPGQPQ